jgi:hypothetical protein
MVTVRTRSMTPDLFSQASQLNAPLSRIGVTTSRHVLPNDLSKAIKQLENRELEELLSAVLAEQRRRRLPTVDGSARKPHVEAVPLTPGKLNAVRAAFGAGITPSRIARQFGLS